MQDWAMPIGVGNFANNSKLLTTWFFFYYTIMIISGDLFPNCTIVVSLLIVKSHFFVDTVDSLFYTN